ncbi:hypothetical protein DV738_g507, partial [Chaetothyriales sp. CBS 135597]
MGSRGLSTSPYHVSGTLPLIIGGKEVFTEKTFPVISPLTGKEVWTSSAASRKEAIAAAEAAHKAFPAWSKTKPAERRDIFLRTAAVIERRREEFNYIINQEIGASEFFQDFMLALSIEGLKDTAGKIADAVQGQVPVSIHDGMKAIIYKVPYGVVLGIAPWNAPYHLGLRSITFALATGNTAVLKGPEFSPRCYWAIVDAFREAGLPDGVLNLIHHQTSDAVEVTGALIAHPAVRKINFTGSTAVGKAIASEAGKYMKPVLMELGGKASAIVLPDADLDLAALETAKGAFINAGQICMSTERILVHSSIADTFKERLQQTVNQVFGEGATSGLPVVSSISANKNRRLLANAVDKGASLLSGEDGSKQTAEVTNFIRPTILANVDPKMDIYAQESFGPSVSLFTFETEQEAIELANNTDYGLSAGIFSRDLGKAFRVADALESGAVHINSMTVHDEFGLPHGGVKSSGYGRFNGTQGLEEFLYSKTVTWMES